MIETAQMPATETQKPQTFSAKAFAAKSATSGLAPHTIARRAPRAQDVQFEILFCGVCHSDLHHRSQRMADGDAYGLSVRAWS